MTSTAKAQSVSEQGKFVFTQDLEKSLNLAHATNENIILFGPGGHAKSEFTMKFFESLGIDPFVKTMGSGTTTDSLFGGIDIMSFNATGKIEYLVENSFMNHEYVIFEELFDAPDFILEQLKDILTSKKFRNGTQSFEIKTKLIVCCTNKTREEFSKNDSLKALMERFPLEYKVIWDAYSKEAYDTLFMTSMGKSFPELSFIMERLHREGTTVSPRTAIKAARILDSCGSFDCLEFIADFSGKNRGLVKEELKKFENVKAVQLLMDECNQYVAKCIASPLDTLEGIKEAKLNIRNLSETVKRLRTKKVDDDTMKMVHDSIEKFNQFLSSKTRDIENATEL